MRNQFIEIELERSSVRLAQWKRGRMICECTEHIPDHYLMDGEIISADALGNWLKAMAAKHGIKGRVCRVILPFHMVYLRMIDYPPMKKQQIRLNLPYEFRDFVRGSMNLYRLEYLVTETLNRGIGEADRMGVMALAVSEDVLENVKNMIDCAGWRLKEITVSPFLYSGRIWEFEKNSGTEKCGNYCLVFLKAEMAAIYFYRGSHLMAYREVERVKGCQNDEEELHQLSKELRQTMEFYHERYPEYKSKRIFVQGDPAESEYLGMQIEEEPGIAWKPMDEFSPLSANVKSPINLAQRETIFRDPGKAIALILGILLGVGIFGWCFVKIPLENRDESRKLLHFMEAEVARYEERNQDYPLVEARYRTCFADYLTEEEQKLTERSACVEEILDCVNHYGQISRMSMEQLECRMEVTNLTRSESADLAEALKLSQVVESVEIMKITMNEEAQTKVVMAELLVILKGRETDAP